MANGFSKKIDFQQVFENFKAICLEKYGKVLSDKDPIVLEFLLLEAVSKAQSSQLSEAIAYCTQSMDEIHKEWLNREEESFKRFGDQTNLATDQIKKLINNQFHDEILKLYHEAEDQMMKNISGTFSQLIKTIKFTSIYLSLIMGLAGGIVGFACARLFS